MADEVVSGGESPIPAVESQTEDSAVNWSDLALEAEDGGDVGDVEGDSAVVEASENVEPPPAEPSAEPAKPAVEAQPPAPAAVAQPAPQTPSQEPPAPAVPAYGEWREKQVEALGKHYAFDEETSAKLLTEPEVVIPQLAARLHMEVVEHTMRSVMAAIPQWIDNYTQGRSRESEAEQLFYNANPDLKDPAYRQAILSMGAAFRQMNQNASSEEAVKVIGAMVRTAMGLAPAATSTPPAVSAPVQQAPAPFTPARGGGGSALPTPTQNNPWASMAEEFLNES